MKGPTFNHISPKFGHSHSEIGGILEIPTPSLSTTVRRFKATGNIQSAPRRGRPAKLDKRTQGRVLREIEVQPNHPWKHCAGNFDIAPITITRAAASDGLHKRKARKKPLLTPAHVLRRLEWARNNSQTDWRSVVFTDEATVESGQRRGTLAGAGESKLWKTESGSTTITWHVK